MHKIIRYLTIFLLLILLLCGCVKEKGINANDFVCSVTDVFGNTAYLPENPRVISCYGSFAECLILAGGELVGVTEDAISERGLEISESTQIVGTVKEINTEILLKLNPDYIILSADIANQVALKEILHSLGLNFGYFRVDSFEDYAILMEKLCTVTKRQDLYKKNVTDVREKIESIKSKVHKKTPSYLLMRVYSTGIRVKTDNIADNIIRELGAVSVTENYPSLLSDLSVEAVIQSNPDFIFILTMGDESAAAEYFKKSVASSPAWSGLDAVKNQRCIMLPKELFHYKPNNRWAESYEYIEKLLYARGEENEG